MSIGFKFKGNEWHESYQEKQGKNKVHYMPKKKVHHPLPPPMLSDLDLFFFNNTLIKKSILILP